MRPLPPTLEAKITGRVVRTGGQILVVCPAHDDGTPSLAIKVTDDGAALLTCHGGCQTQDILAAWGLSFRDIMGEKKKEESTGEWTPVKDQFGNFLPASAVYRYVDEKGVLIYEVVRVNMPDGKKSFRQRRPDATKPSGWAWNLDGTRPLLYRLPKVLEAVASGEEVLCYTPDTEVLTPTGWVAMPDLPRDAPVAQWDLDSEAVSFAVPSAYHQYRYEGDLVHIVASHADLLVTPDHRQPRRHVRNRVSDGQRMMTKPKVVRADSLGIHAILPVAGLLAGMGGPDDVTARLLVAWLADGVDEPRGLQISFNLKKDRKKNRLRRLLSEAGVPWSEHVYPSVPAWTNFRIRREHFVAVLDLAGEGKRWRWEWLRWAAVTRRAMIDEVGHWDGDFGGVHDVGRSDDAVPDHAPVRLFSAEAQDADVLAAMACITGYGAIVHRNDRAARPEQAPQYIVNVHRRRTPGADGPGHWRQASRRPDRVAYDGEVFCLTVPTSFLVVRRNGKITISGNCVEGEKDVHTAESLGYTATCNSGGAGKFLPEMADVFKDGAHILIVADADEPGRKHARLVKALVEECGGIVRVAEALHGKDLTDHVSAGGTMADLQIVDETEMPDLGMIDFVDLIGSAEDPYDWLVPGLLERNERFIFTGPEGLGKTTFLRQFATSIACGIHPFQHTSMEPKRVVWFDAENSKNQNRRAFGPLGRIAASMGRPVDPGRFSFFLRPDGIDLGKPDDAAWFFERLAITKPDLVIIGPWYRLFIGNPNDEEVARKVVATLDTARAKYGFAVLIEAHSPHQDGFKANKMGGVRPVRPIGSSLLLRWPEYGYGLSFRDPEPGVVPAPGDSPIIPGMPDPNYADFMAWRGARDEREWPQAVRRSNDPDNWPWLACESKDMAHPIEAVRGAIERTDTYPKGEAPAADAWGAGSGWGTTF